MKYPSSSFVTQNNILFIRTFMILLLSCGISKLNLCFSSVPSLLKVIPLEGHLSFEANEFAARDYGNLHHSLPLAVLYPKSVSDIANTIKYIWQMGPSSKLTVVARGHGHSINGQSQAEQGIVINMKSLHLTVGGTLSNAGISGQAFRHGPQISNVHQTCSPELVSGKGEVLNCSEEQNADLFHSVLGGLGQFGIITYARISLEPAPKTVKWIRVLYSDFSTFSQDQEYLITAENTFDYIEGFVMINKTGLVNRWRSSSFSPHDPVQASQFVSDGRTLYCLELTKNFNPENVDTINQEIESLLSQLNYIPSTLFVSEVPYVEFLDRVRASELKLRRKGLWDIPHPWLNLLIPKSKIKDFAEGVFGKILRDTSNGPVLLYPVNKSKWDNRTSFVAPEDDIFYLAAFLFHVVPSSPGTEGLEHILNKNKRILDFCKEAHLGVKQYLPHYTTQEEWRTHFGQRWEVFARRKSAYDPLAILAPGQRIFQKAISIL